MNEFDEEKINEEPQSGNQPESSAGTENNSAPTEENPTYHYAYRKPDEQPKNDYNTSNNYNQNTAYNQNNSYNPNQSYSPYANQSYYTPPSGNAQQTVVTDEKPKKEKNKVIIGIVIALAICLIAAIVGIAASIGSKDSTDEKETKPNSSAQVETNDQGDVAKTDKDGNFTVAGIAEKCIDSCVGITVYTEASNYSNFYNYGFDRNNSAQSGEEVKSGEGSCIFMLEYNGRT